MMILTVIGARPQFIKAAMVSQALKKAGIEEVIIHTGQHFDTNMSQVFFDEMGIPAPLHTLDFGGLSHGAMTGRMLEALEGLMLELKPNCVLVYGDTNSTLAGALAANKLHIPLAHVEAGMRSYNKTMPEEVNRVMVDHLSQLLLVPHTAAAQNLEKESLTEGIHVVGDIMMDATLAFKDQVAAAKILSRLGISSEHYLLATLHRAENTDDPSRLQAWLRALEKISLIYPIIMAMHPRTRRRIAEYELSWNTTSIHLCDPLPYTESIALLSQATALLTDSGGMQKEAYYLQTPCLTLRPETEWSETVSVGWNQLIAEPEELTPESLRIFLAQERKKHPSFYGTGQTRTQIVDVLSTYLGKD